MATRFLLSILAHALILCLLLPPVVAAESSGSNKKIIGQETWVRVEELGLDFLARVDTGAASTSLHAYEIAIAEGTDDSLENLGKHISFRTYTEAGEHKRIKAEIVRVQTVNTAKGSEKRYVVWLTLQSGGVRKKIQVNLRDRSTMQYKLLLGRDWLANDFLVDVDLMADKQP